MAYAKTTKVPVVKTIGEIQTTLMKAGAKGFAFGSGQANGYIAFTMGTSAIKMKFKLPPPPSSGANQASVKTHEQLMKSRYRAVLLCVKAKIEAVEAGVETLEQAFLPHILLQNGTLVGDVIIPKIEMLNDTPAALALGL